MESKIQNKYEMLFTLNLSKYLHVLTAMAFIEKNYLKYKNVVSSFHGRWNSILLWVASSTMSNAKQNYLSHEIAYGKLVNEKSNWKNNYGLVMVWISIFDVDDNESMIDF